MPTCITASFRHKDTKYQKVKLHKDHDRFLCNFFIGIVGIFPKAALFICERFKYRTIFNFYKIEGRRSKGFKMIDNLIF